MHHQEKLEDGIGEEGEYPFLFRPISTHADFSPGGDSRTSSMRCIKEQLVYGMGGRGPISLRTRGFEYHAIACNLLQRIVVDNQSEHGSSGEN